MDIVTNNIVLRYFKKISIFKTDLGFNLKGPAGRKKTDNSIIKIKDTFIKKYTTMTGNFISKYGEIGSLKFYEDTLIPYGEFHIYDNDQIYEIEMKPDDYKKEPGVYLTEILQMIEKGSMDNDKDENENNMIKNVTYTNMPEDLERPNMNLPKEQYIEALINHHRMIEKLN
jgi:hypothetical protein